MVKLLVCCHKDSLRGDDLRVTVKAGAALGIKDVSCDFSDDFGDNISLKNPQYNELSVLYWAWKNYAVLGDPDCIGLMHYRRYFYFDPDMKDTVLRTSAPIESLAEIAHVSEDKVEEILSRGTFICPRPLKRRSVYKQYSLTGDKSDLDLALSVLKDVGPEYVEAAEEYLAGKDCYFFNMFVFPKEIFMRYCSFIFPILEAYLERKGGTERLFISERLTGIFIHKLLREGATPVYLPVLFREEDVPFSRKWEQAKGIKNKVLTVARLFMKRRGERRRI